MKRAEVRLKRKSTVVPYEIIVPSRRRVGNMRRIAELLPTARVCVDEREAADYRPAVPRGRLLLHARTETLGEVRQWVLDHVKTECVVMVDDDFLGVDALVGRRSRRIQEPGAILQIIENAVNTAADLGLALFCWSRAAMRWPLSAHDPFSLTGPASNAWGVIGRQFRVDTTLNLCESLDLTLQNLVERRIVLYDRRYYFMHGSVWKGEGGLQGMRTSDAEAAEKAKMKRRWGAYVSFERKLKGGSTGMAIRVPRRSGLVSKR